MLQIDSINHDYTCGFKIIFRFETYKDTIAFAHIIKGLVATISYPPEKGLKPDEAFFQTICDLIPHESVTGITRVATYDAEESTPILDFGTLDPSDMEAVNKVFNEAHGFRKNHGYPDSE